MQIGTVISKFATPIAGVLGLDCYDDATGDLKPESPCAKTRNRLNAAKSPREFGQAIFDRFRSGRTKGDTMPDEQKKEPSYYILVVLVPADDAVEALAKKNDGKVIAVNPQSKAPSVQFGGGGAKPSSTGQVITRGVNQPNA